MKKMILPVLFCLSLLVLSSVGFAQVTTPEEYLGYKPGADFKLMTYEEALGYYEQLASQTDRMQMFDMGPTSMDRRMKYAIVSSEENMANLAQYKEINRKLSLAGNITENEAVQLSDDGKVIVWIDGGLHGTEVAPAQLMVKLAYNLVTGEDRVTKKIRDNVITLLVFANPDGMTIVSDWYMKNVGTPFEVSRIPWLYHKYAGHDNNRDSFMSNLVETKNMNKVQNHEWYPAVLYNQHQRGPFPARIWIPPEAEPTNPNLHPIVTRWKNLVGAAMGKAFEEAKLPGVISRVRYDSWYPGYVTQVVDGHNIVSILTETQLYGYATPHFYTVNDFPKEHKDLIKGTFYPNPWIGGWWRIGDAVAYNFVACRSVLEVAAKYRYEFLYNKYRMAVEVKEKFSSSPPYGWIIPAKQKDPNTTALLLERMRINGVEVLQAEEPFEMDGLSYEKGTFVISTNQPFGYYVKNMFENQQYPDLREYPHLWQGLIGMEEWDGPPLRAYDGAGWTLPLQMGVEYREMSRPFEANFTKLETISPPDAVVRGRGSQYVLSPYDNNSFAAVYAILKQGGNVSRAKDNFTLNGKSFQKGAFVINGGSVSADFIQSLASEKNTDFYRGSVRVSTEEIKLPRIAIYKSWVASMDAGWMTYIFDQFGFDFHLLSDGEIKAGSLRGRFDAIILPDQGTESMVSGHKKGTIHPDYVGGMTERGVDNLKEFVNKGGTLICNNNSSDLPIKYFGLPLKNALKDVKPDVFNCPGSILKMKYDTGQAVSYGMPEMGVSFFSRGRAFDLDEETDSEINTSVLARFPDENLLLSGWILGEDNLRGKPAAVDVSYGSGHVVLFGFNVHNRAQSHSTFKLLFNAMFYN